MTSFYKLLVRSCFADSSYQEKHPRNISSFADSAGEEKHLSDIMQSNTSCDSKNPDTTETSRSYVSSVYYPNWHVYQDRPPSSLNISNITHISYAFIGVNEDGSLKWIDEWADLNKQVDGEQGGLAALAKLKRNNAQLRTVISIGGGSNSKEFPAMAASTPARQTFARQLRTFCDRYQFDGIDIDWESPENDKQGSDFVKLLQACRDSLPKPKYLITTALPVGQYILKHIDLVAVSRIVDFANLMAYDFTGPWTTVSGNMAQLHSTGSDLKKMYPALKTCAADSVDYFLSKGFPSRQLILGIPAYGRNFPKADGPGCSTEGAGELDYFGIPDKWATNAVVDDTAVASWYIDTEGGKGFVTFDVPRTVIRKAQYVKEKRLGGLFYWTGSGDKAAGLSLVAAGKRTLESR